MNRRMGVLHESAKGCGNNLSKCEGWLRVVLGVLLLLLQVSLLAGTAAGQSPRVRPVNLAQMVDLAGLIVRGQVTSIRSEKHPELTNVDTVVITLRVRDVLKGTAGDEVTFRQYIWDARDAGSRLGYKVGEEVLLMLLPESRYGLTSPAGFEQGRFRVSVDAAGNPTVTNGWNNRGLMRGVETALPQLQTKVSPAARVLVQQHREGPISYATFKDLIRGAIAARQ